MKIGKWLGLVPIGIGYVLHKAEKASDKKKAKDNVNTLDNLEKLYSLKKSGAISEEDYVELKEKLKGQI